MPLKAYELDRLDRRGLYGDGDGLYLSVAKGGSKSWIYRYQVNGRRRDLGLGGYPAVSLAKARSRRDDARQQVRQGIDPLEARDLARAERERARQLESEQQHRNSMTFRRLGEEFIDLNEAGWGNRKHAQQWRSTLTTYAYPVLGDLPVAGVTTEHVLLVISPIWTEKTETAKRVQGRIERVLDYATTKGFRDGENPARWRGHLDNVLPKPGKVHRVEHQRALPYDDAPALASDLRGVETAAGRALLLTLLCATRTSETLEATWSEVDLDRKEWRIPASRMKAGKEHRIPLCDAAVAVLKAQSTQQDESGDWVFPGQKRGKCLSNMAMTNVLKRTGWLERTSVHGLRSTFRDWVGEKTRYRERMAEVALAHQLTDKVQAAYFRADLMEQRREMMKEWALFLGRQTGAVGARAAASPGTFAQ